MEQSTATSPEVAIVVPQAIRKEALMRIYIGNLSRDATDADLREVFQPFGTLTSVSVIKDKFSGVSKGFAFVEMPEKAEAEAAIAGLHRTQLKGQSMDVVEARPREERKPNRGGGGGWGKGHSGGRRH